MQSFAKIKPSRKLPNLQLKYVALYFFICYCTIKDFSAGVFGVICTKNDIDRGDHKCFIL